MTDATIEEVVEEAIEKAIIKTNNEESPNLSSYNSLMDLRLIILRTFADVWKDDRDGGGTLRGKLVQMSPIELNKYFDDTFGYQSPYENFGVKFIQGKAKWNWYGDNQWTKVENETLTISVPANEKKWDEYDRAIKLMEFYNYFPTFFGTSRVKDNARLEYVTASERSEKLAVAKNAAVNESSTSMGIDFHGNDYNLGVSEDLYLSFGAVVMKLIAAAWENQELMDKINYHSMPNRDKCFEDNYYKEINHILLEYYQFKNPWSFNLKFEVPDKYKSFWVDGVWRKKGDDGEQLIRNRVNLEIPITPTKESKANISMALARYNAIGPAYPFTCS